MKMTSFIPIKRWMNSLRNRTRDWVWKMVEPPSVIIRTCPAIIHTLRISSTHSMTFKYHLRRSNLKICACIHRRRVQPALWQRLSMQQLPAPAIYLPKHWRPSTKIRLNNCFMEISMISIILFNLDVLRREMSGGSAPRDRETEHGRIFFVRLCQKLTCWTMTKKLRGWRWGRQK